MKVLLNWILGLTKVGKVAKQIQAAVDGKKQMIASLAAAVVATATILTKFGEQGTKYLLEVASTPEFVAASAGWIGFFNALKGEKIRQENAQIIEKLDAAPKS